MKVNMWPDKMRTEAVSTGELSEPDHWFRVGTAGTGSQNRFSLTTEATAERLKDI